MNFIKTHKKDFIYCSVIALLAVAALVLGIALANKKSEEEQSYYYDKKCEVFLCQSFEGYYFQSCPHGISNKSRSRISA